MTGAPSKCWENRSTSIVAEVMTTLRSGRRGSSVLEVAEEEVDVEAALVGLVDDERVVAREHPVALDLGEQDAVGHHLDQRPVADPVGEPDRPADEVADVRAELLGDALGDGARGDPAGLGVADHARVPRPSSRQIFGSWVVLPDPVSPATTTTWWSRISAAISSRTAETGSSG